MVSETAGPQSESISFKGAVFFDLPAGRISVSKPFGLLVANADGVIVTIRPRWAAAIAAFFGNPTAVGRSRLRWHSEWKDPISIETTRASILLIDSHGGRCLFNAKRRRISMLIAALDRWNVPHTAVSRTWTEPFKLIPRGQKPSKK